MQRDEVDAAILRLKWDKKESFSHPPKPTVRLDITAPKKPDKTYKSRTAYAYQVKTTFSPKR